MSDKPMLPHRVASAAIPPWFVVAATGLEAGADAPAQVPWLLQPGWVIVQVLTAGLLAWLLARLAQIPALQQFGRWFSLGRVLLWVAVLQLFAMAVAARFIDYWLVVGIFTVVVLAVSNLSWLRSVIAGLSVAFEGRFDLGDTVRIGDIEGEITAFGLRSVQVYGRDGMAHEIPNEKFINESVASQESRGDSACEIIFRVPEGYTRDEVVEHARRAAFLTPLASPRHSPEVFLDVEEEDDEVLRIRIRGYAFRATHRDHYQSEVLARLQDLLEQS